MQQGIILVFVRVNKQKQQQSNKKGPLERLGMQQGIISVLVWVNKQKQQQPNKKVPLERFGMQQGIISVVVWVNIQKQQQPKQTNKKGPLELFVRHKSTRKPTNHKPTQLQKCESKVHGSDGAAFNPYIKPSETLWFFNDQLCRAMPLVWAQNVEHKGLPGLRWAGYFAQHLDCATFIGADVNFYN